MICSTSKTLPYSSLVIRSLPLQSVEKEEQILAANNFAALSIDKSKAYIINSTAQFCQIKLMTQQT
jgi:hypothetical protein